MEFFISEARSLSLNRSRLLQKSRVGLGVEVVILEIGVWKSDSESWREFVDSAALLCICFIYFLNSSAFYSGKCGDFARLL